MTRITSLLSNSSLWTQPSKTLKGVRNINNTRLIKFVFYKWQIYGTSKIILDDLELSNITEDRSRGNNVFDLVPETDKQKQILKKMNKKRQRNFIVYHLHYKNFRKICQVIFEKYSGQKSVGGYILSLKFASKVFRWKRKTLDMPAVCWSSNSSLV